MITIAFYFWGFHSFYSFICPRVCVIAHLMVEMIKLPGFLISSFFLFQHHSSQCTILFAKNNHTHTRSFLETVIITIIIGCGKLVNKKIFPKKITLFVPTNNMIFFVHISNNLLTSSFSCIINNPIVIIIIIVVLIANSALNY